MTGESSITRRERMVLTQIVRRGIRDARVLDAMRTVPREKFVTAEDEEDAYQDTSLQIGCQQTISQPYIVAYMTEQLHIQPQDIVLDIGTGSGYQAAILSRLAAHVYSIETIKTLSAEAKARFAQLQYENITVVRGDGSQGLPRYAPFNAILAAAAAPNVPEPLVRQLAPGGRMILPVGGPGNQVLRLVIKNLQEEIISTDLIGVRFVPLRGELGWSEQQWQQGRD